MTRSILIFLGICVVLKKGNAIKIKITLLTTNTKASASERVNGSIIEGVLQDYEKWIENSL